MYISTRAHYGLHIMVELAKRKGKKTVSLAELSAGYGFSIRYLGHLMRALRTAGLVESSRGIKGGFSLAKDPSSIRLIEIIEALEGKSRNIAGGCGDKCSRSKNCALRLLWEEARDSFLGVFKERTLKALLEEELEKEQAQALDYVI